MTSCERLVHRCSEFVSPIGLVDQRPVDMQLAAFD
jgi:hypothetical protein